MTQNKRVVGITGGSGSGKSYISAELKGLGVPVIDCDVLAREVMEEGHPCLLETVACFGEGILSGGRLNRKKLAELVFSSPEKLQRLNEITHKYILSEIYNRIEAESAPLILVDGAVLLESGISCDLMVGILADRDIRRLRIMQRDGLTCEEAERRISAQKPDSFYEENCDLVIKNNGKDFDAEAFLKRIS